MKNNVCFGILEERRGAAAAIAAAAVAAALVWVFAADAAALARVASLLR
jgi:hypothetical protein